LLDIWIKLLSVLNKKAVLDWQEAFIDGSSAPAKRWATASAKRKGGKMQSDSMADGQGIPLGSTLTSVPPVTLAEEKLETIKVP